MKKVWTTFMMLPKSGSAEMKVSGKSGVFAILCFIAIFMISGDILAQTNTWDGSSDANWNTPANWSLNHVPLAAEDVVIPDGITATITVNTAAVCATFTMNGGATANTVTISGANSLAVTNGISIGAGTGAGDNKTLAVNAGTLSSASITIAATGNNNRSSGVTISTGTVTVTGSITMGDTRDVVTFSGAGTLNIGNTMTGGTFTASTGTVNYNGVAQTAGAYTYNNLTLSGSGVKNISGINTTIGGNFTIGGSASATAASALTISGAVTLGSGTSFTPGAFVHSIAGDWTNNGATFNNTGSTINLNGAAQSIGGSSSTNFNNLALSGSNTKTFSVATFTSGKLSIATGVVANLGTITNHTANSLRLGGTAQVAGTWGGTGSGAANVNTTFFAATAGLLTVMTTVSSETYYSRATGNWNSNTTWSTVDYTSSINTGGFPIAGDIVNIGGNFTVTVTAAAACSSITFEEASNTNTLSINSAITLNVSGAITIPRPNNPDVNTLAVGAGTLNVASIAFTSGGGNQRHVLTISTGTVTVSGDVTQNGSTGSATVTFTGAGLLQLGGTFLTSATGSFSSSTGTVQYNGAAQTVGDFDYNNLTLSGSGVKDMTGVANISGNFVTSGTASVTAAAALTIGGGVTLGSGTSFTAGTFTHNVAGNWTNNGATFTGTNSTINLNGAAQSIGGTSTTPFNNLSLAGTNTKTFSSSFATIISGSLSIATGVVANLGTLTTHTARTLTLGGNGQTTGTWGGTGSGATNINTTFFAAVAGRITISNRVYFTRATGNWNATATWSTVAFGGAAATAFPVAGDDVNIGGGSFTVTVNVASACSTITYESNATNSPIVTISSGITLNVSGAITIPRASNNNPDINTLAVGAGVLNAGSLAFTNGGGGQRHELTISTGTATISGDVTQSGSNGSATITFTGAGLLRLGGAFLTSATGTLTQSTGTVEYNGTAQTVGDFTYNNLTLSGSGVKDISGVTNIGGNFVTSGTASTTAAAALTIGGSVTLGSGTSFTAGAFTHNVAGSWTNNGATFTGTSSTINFNGTAQSIGGTSSTTFENLTLAGSGTKTFGSVAPTIVSGNLSIATGVVANLGTLTTHTARTLTLGGNGQTTGTWGGTGSGATNINTTFFAAVAGRITVSNRIYYTRQTGNWNANATWSTVTYGNATNGGTFPVAGDDVNVGGNLTVTVTVNAACGTLSFQSGTNNTNTVTINSGITLAVSGAITIPRSSNPDINTLAVGAGTLTAASIAFTNGGGGQRHVLSISTGTATVSGSITQTGSSGSATISFTGAGLLQVGGAFLTSATGTLTTSTGTVEYNGAAQTVGDFTYYNLRLSGSGAKDLTGVTTISNNFILAGTATAAPPASLTIGGGVTLGAGTVFTGGALTHNVAGNWTNNGGTFTATNTTINLNGTTAQTIGGSSSTSFYGLTVNNTFGTIPQIIVGINTTVTNRLTMTSGVVNLAGFSFTISSSSSGALSHGLISSNGWMYGGNIVRAVPTTAITLLSVDGFFPAGTSSNFRPFFVGKTSNGSSAGSITISHTGVASTSVVSIADGTTIVRRDDDFWTVSTSGSSAGATYGIRYGGTGLGTVTNLSHLHACLSATVVGTHVTATSVSLTDPRVERSGLTHANLTNSFYVGSDNLASPLPIQLVAFNATVLPDGVGLNWTTATEFNNDFFTIERTSSTEKFEQVSIVKGQGNSKSKTDYFLVDENPLAGISYYRLKQTDFDGKFTYSELRKVEVTGVRTQVKVYPNPAVDNKFNVELTGVNPGVEVPLKVINSMGASVFESTCTADQNGRVKAVVDLSSISSGVYILNINSETGLKKRVLVQ